MRADDVRHVGVVPKKARARLRAVVAVHARRRQRPGVPGAVGPRRGGGARTAGRGMRHSAHSVGARHASPSVPQSQTVEPVARRARHASPLRCGRRAHRSQTDRVPHEPVACRSAVLGAAQPARGADGAGHLCASTSAQRVDASTSYDIAARGRVAVLPFLDLVYLINPGVSYSLIEMRGPVGQAAAVAVRRRGFRRHPRLDGPTWRPGWAAIVPGADHGRRAGQRAGPAVPWRRGGFLRAARLWLLLVRV